MNEMKRLVDESGETKLSIVLRSMRSAAPPHEVERRRAIVGAMRAATSASSRGRAVKRALALGIPLGLLALGSAMFAVGPKGTEPTKLETRPAVPAAAVSEAPRAEAPRAETSTQGTRVEDLPSAAPGRALPRPRSSADSTAGRDESANISLDDELALIDLARASLAGRRGAETLSRVAEYRTKFTTPHFADEADALEIQALAALGRTEEARKKAERFLSAHPRSLYVERVRSVVNLKD